MFILLGERVKSTKNTKPVSEGNQNIGVEVNAEKLKNSGFQDTRQNRNIRLIKPLKM
jgi:hypothetical protein